MKVAEFDFVLPPELIAQRPIVPRDRARLLEVGAAGLRDRRIADLPDLLQPGDLLLFNDTRVLPTRLAGRRGEAAIEVTLVEPTAAPDGESRWLAFARPARKCRLADRLDFAPDLSATVAAKGPAGALTLAFPLPEAALLERLRRHGRMPLPPYIRSTVANAATERHDYQTMFATADGAVAAPTAGLHFTPALLTALAARGVEHGCITLHVGPGTFLPVRVEDTAGHRMHAERYVVGATTARQINRARAEQRRIIAVGTTVLRTLEAAADAQGLIQPGAGRTDLFITPGYRFRLVDQLLTNFHLPRSTLLMLAAAFAGLERIRAAYAHAIAQGYRFYSYGDACLLSRQD